MISKLNVALSLFNSSDWWYDSGATIHVYNNKSMFKTYENAPKRHVVVIGNHDTVKVYGKGVVDLQFTFDKKLVLTSILHIPDMRKNLIYS